MAPRPILKRASSPAPRTHPSPNVHFPPSPSLTSTFAAYSAAAYDRSPIVVTRNACALPERGCPGRTYTLADSPPASPSPTRRVSFARDYHPRALSISSNRASSASSSSSNHNNSDLSLAVPSLIPDLSSESEESDSFAPAPADQPSNANFGMFGLAGPAHHIPTKAEYTIHDLSNNSSSYPPTYESPAAAALSFLPYSPSASPTSSPYMYEDMDDLPTQKPRRRPSPSRKHDASRNQDRIRISSTSPPATESSHHLASAFSALSLSSAPPCTPPKRKSSSRRNYLASVSFSSPVFKEEDNCLSGF